MTKLKLQLGPYILYALFIRNCINMAINWLIHMQNLMPIIQPTHLNIPCARWKFLHMEFNSNNFF